MRRWRRFDEIFGQHRHPFTRTHPARKTRRADEARSDQRHHVVLPGLGRPPATRAVVVAEPSCAAASSTLSFGGGLSSASTTNVIPRGIARAEADPRGPPLQVGLTSLDLLTGWPLGGKRCKVVTWWSTEKEKESTMQFRRRHGARCGQSLAGQDLYEPAPKVVDRQRRHDE